MAPMNPHEPPKDHVDDPGRSDYSTFDENIRSKATWQRLLFMFVLALLYSLGLTVGCVIVILQFFWVLFTGETKPELALVGRQLGEYGRQIALYLTFNTEDRPFPFDLDWPSEQ